MLSRHFRNPFPSKAAPSDEWCGRSRSESSRVTPIRFSVAMPRTWTQRLYNRETISSSQKLQLEDLKWDRIAQNSTGRSHGYNVSGYPTLLLSIRAAGLNQKANVKDADRTSPKRVNLHLSTE